MKYSIEVSETNDYIIISVYGDVTSETAMQFITESHKLGNELGIMKFLVDVRKAKNVQMVGDNYQFASQDVVNAPDVDRKAKVVFLVSHEDHSHDFIETVLKNTGFNVALYRDKDEALAHLLK